MYPPRLIEHFQNPRNVGELAPPAITVEVANPACGDTLRLSVRLHGFDRRRKRPYGVDSRQDARRAGGLRYGAD
jgi:hypothetical protein